MPLPLRGKSVLQTPDPFHIPGYAGHTPQAGFKCGQSFAPVTHELLTNPDVKKSGYSVLAHTNDDIKSTADILQEKRRDIMESRVASWGDQKYKYPIVPGYTGQVPRMENYCGRTFAECTFNAITEFENSQRIKRLKHDHLIALNCLQSGDQLPLNLKNMELPPLKTRNRMPLQRARQDMLAYESPNKHIPPLSVLKMHNESPHKRFIAGYGGFVPRTHELFGKDYEHVTHDALNVFTDERKKQEIVLSTPVDLNRHYDNSISHCELYPTTAGMSGKYTGHIPGGKYHFGRTYWQSTINAKDKMATEKMKWSEQMEAVTAN